MCCDCSRTCLQQGISLGASGKSANSMGTKRMAEHLETEDATKDEEAEEDARLEAERARKAAEMEANRMQV